MEEHIFVIVNGLRVKIKMSYHIISYQTDAHINPTKREYFSTSLAGR
jgi:hypothetical protein